LISLINIFMPYNILYSNIFFVLLYLNIRGVRVDSRLNHSDWRYWEDHW
jgi:hypothetical protein